MHVCLKTFGKIDLITYFFFQNILIRSCKFLYFFYFVYCYQIILSIYIEMSHTPSSSCHHHRHHNNIHDVVVNLPLFIFLEWNIVKKGKKYRGKKSQGLQFNQCSVRLCLKYGIDSLQKNLFINHTYYSLTNKHTNNS